MPMLAKENWVNHLESTHLHKHTMLRTLTAVKRKRNVSDRRMDVNSQIPTSDMDVYTWADHLTDPGMHIKPAWELP